MADDDKTIFSKKHRENIAKAMTGKRRTEEQKRKISESRKAYWSKVKEAMTEPVPEPASEPAPTPTIETLKKQLDLLTQEIERLKKK